MIIRQIGISCSVQFDPGVRKTQLPAYFTAGTDLCKTARRLFFHNLFRLVSGMESAFHGGDEDGTLWNGLR